MYTTPYHDVNNIVRDLCSRLQRILKDTLAGVYLYGSRVTDDFDHDISDIDLLVVTTTTIDQLALDRLRTMHAKIAAALTTFRSERSTTGMISPGEPLHFKGAGSDYLINWWTVREKGVALFGPDPSTLIEPISHDEFLQAVRDQVRAWNHYITLAQHSRPFQAYAILTLCRAMYAQSHGGQTSKRRAARWAAAEFPRWASLIDNALAWRVAYHDQNVDHEATYGQTLNFARYVIDDVSGNKEPITNP